VGISFLLCRPGIEPEVRFWGTREAPPVAESSDPSEWPRSARDEGAPPPRTFAEYRNRVPAAEKTPFGVLFQRNPPFRVGEILLRNVKFSLRSSEIAAAVGGFLFTFCVSRKYPFAEDEISS